MKKCPICKRTMSRNMVYNYGTPIITFRCKCGYEEGKLFNGQQESKSHFRRKMKK